MHGRIFVRFAAALLLFSFLMGCSMREPMTVSAGSAPPAPPMADQAKQTDQVSASSVRLPVPFLEQLGLGRLLSL